MPSSLMFNTTNEQIDSSKNIVDYISDILMTEEEANDSNFVREFKKNISKDLVPSIDWEKYEEIKRLTKQAINKNNLENENEMDLTGNMDMGGEEEMNTSGEEEMNTGGEEEIGRGGEEKDYSSDDVSIENERDIKAAKSYISKNSEESKELKNIEAMEKDLS